MKPFQIKVNNLTRDMVLARLIGLGFTFAGKKYESFEKLKERWTHSEWDRLYYEENQKTIHGDYESSGRLTNLTLDELFSDSFVYKGAFETIKVKLNSEYMAEVSEDKITVGCQSFDFATFDKLAEAVKKAREFNK